MYNNKVFIDHNGTGGGGGGQMERTKKTHTKKKMRKKVTTRKEGNKEEFTTKDKRIYIIGPGACMVDLKSSEIELKNEPP